MRAAQLKLPATIQMHDNQQHGNLKGESVVAAILPSHRGELLLGRGDKLENFDLIFFPTSKT